MADIPFLANSIGPPWLPQNVAEARRFAYWGQLIFFIFFFIQLIFGVISLVFGVWVSGAYLIVSGVINLIIVYMMKATVFDSIDQGRFNEASDRLLIWGILGIIFGILPGIFIIIAFLKIQEAFQPQYQPYPPQQPGQAPPQQYQQPPQQPGQAPPQQYQQPPQQPGQAPPQQYQQPPAQVSNEPARPQVPPQAPQARPQSQSQKQKHEMVKCKKCGVQYPAFMRTCPNCGEPR